MAVADRIDVTPEANPARLSDRQLEMGYNLYVVKSRGCLDQRNRFTEAEWNEICANHQVADWLCFDGNDITVKNPSREQIVALVHVAKTRGWSVQGDDGESYADDGSSIPAARPPIPTLLCRLRQFLDLYRGTKATPKSVSVAACPFKVGDRVRTTYRSGGVVISADPTGHHGRGSIKVRFPDGATLGGMFRANDFFKEQD